MSESSNIVTQQTGRGAVMTLDLDSIPETMKRRIIEIAFRMGIFVGNGEIRAEAEGSSADEVLDELTVAMNELDGLFIPTAPGLDPHSFAKDTYPVIRDGRVVDVSREELTDAELKATIQRLNAQALDATRHAVALGALK